MYEGDSDSPIGVLLAGREVIVKGARAPQRGWGDPDGPLAASRIRGCGQGAFVALQAGRAVAIPARCGHGLCAGCARARGARRADALAGPWEEMVRRGYGAASVTLTQPAVEGEALVDTLARLMTAWRRMMDHRAVRDVWRSSVVGYLRGREVTGRSKRSSVRRWHAHLHVVVILEQGVPSDWIVPAWLRVASGASVRAQHVADIAPDDARRALGEALKYPGKLGDMSDEQLWEYWLVTRGTKPVQVGGVVHGATRTGRLCRAIREGRLDDEVKEDAVEYRWASDWVESGASEDDEDDEDDEDGVIDWTPRGADAPRRLTPEAVMDPAWPSGPIPVRVRGRETWLDGDVIQSQLLERMERE